MADNHETWVAVAIAFLTGTFGVKLLDSFRDSSKNKMDTYKDLLDRLEKEMIEIKADNKALRIELDELKSRNKDLEHQLVLLQSADNLYPFPMWLKSPQGIMMVINREYERVFGISKNQYIGKTDIDVWGEEIGAEFWENDLAILRGARLKIGFEPVPKMFGDWMIVKFPLKLDKTIIGLKGYALPIHAEDIETMKRINKEIAEEKK